MSKPGSPARFLTGKAGYHCSSCSCGWQQEGRAGCAELDTEPQPQCPHARLPGLRELEDMTLEDEASWTQAPAICCQGNTSVPRPLRPCRVGAFSTRRPACPWQPSSGPHAHPSSHLPQRSESTKTIPNTATKVHTVDGDTEARSWGATCPWTVHLQYAGLLTQVS